MAKIIERDGAKIVMVEKEFSENELKRRIQAIEVQIENIDRNILGLQQKRERLVSELEEITSLQSLIGNKEAGPIDPAS